MRSHISAIVLRFGRLNGGILASVRGRLHSSELGRLAVLLFLPLLAATAGCQLFRSAEVTPAPVSYEDLCGLTGVQMGVMSTDDTCQWIEQKYSSVPRRSQRVIGGESVVVYAWEQNGSTGNAYLRDGSLLRVSWHNIENGPTFGQVVANLGTPEMVDHDTIVHDPVLYAIDLDYPGLGLSVSASGMEKWNKLEHGGKLATHLAENMVVDRVECYVPGSMEEVLRDAFFLSPEMVSIQMQRRIPWPGFGALVPLE